MKITGILIGLGGALLCILTQKNDDLASDAFTGNLLCLLSSMAYAIYLIASNRILKHVGVMTMLRYTFSGAAFSAIIVSGFTGFEATLFTFPIHWKPMAVLAFVLIFPTVISYLLIPVGLKYLKTTLVAIYGYLILIVATITSLALGQDRFSWSQLIAVLLIYSSVWKMIYRLIRFNSIPCMVRVPKVIPIILFLNNWKLKSFLELLMSFTKMA